MSVFLVYFINQSKNCLSHSNNFNFQINASCYATFPKYFKWMDSFSYIVNHMVRYSVLYNFLIVHSLLKDTPTM